MTWSRVGRGFDTLDFRGADRPAGETFSIDPNGSGATFNRPGGTIDLTVSSAFSSRLRASTDNITINDLTGTDVKQVAIDLGGGDPDGDGDGFEDTVSINATNGQRSRSPTSNGVVTVSGLASTVTISNFEEDTRSPLDQWPTRHSHRWPNRHSRRGEQRQHRRHLDGKRWLARCRAARPVHGIELRDGRRWSRCNTGCRSTTGPAAVAGAAARLRRHRAPENASEH